MHIYIYIHILMPFCFQQWCLPLEAKAPQDRNHRGNALGFLFNTITCGRNIESFSINIS